MSKISVFNPAKELDALENRVALSQCEEVKSHETFIVRAALRAEGWDPCLCETAIARGFKRRAGEEIGPAPWRELEETFESNEAAKFTTKTSAKGAELFVEQGIRGLQRALEVQGDSAAEEDEGTPRRMPHMRINLLDKESQEREKVHQERSKELVDDYWDCPNCGSVNKLEEDVCPTCNLDKSFIEIQVLNLMGSINTGLFSKDEHIKFLNDIIIIRRKNKRWISFLKWYMKKNNLVPSDMAGLIGPRPWRDDPLWSNIEDEEIPEKENQMDILVEQSQSQEQSVSVSDKELMQNAFTAHFEEKEKKLGKVKEHIKETLEASSSTECPKCDIGMLITGEHPGSWVCPECGWNVGYPEGEHPSLKFLQDNQQEIEEKEAIPPLDRRLDVIVSDDHGWLCLDCSRVWPDDFDNCVVCELKKKAAEKPEVPTSRPPTLDEYDRARKAFEELDEEKDSGLTMDIRCTECCSKAVGSDACHVCGEPTKEGEQLPEGASLAEEIKNAAEMDFAEKARLMMLLKAKEKKDEPVSNEQGDQASS